jgi:hypothetical protein
VEAQPTPDAGPDPGSAAAGCRLLLVFHLLLIGVLASSEPGGMTRYIDAQAGLDGATGDAPAAPWRTLHRARAQVLPPGSAILLRRGSVFREQLTPLSGAPGRPIRYAAYGTGPKPVLLGSLAAERAADWVHEGDGIWRCASDLPMDVGNLYFLTAGAVAVGHKRWRLADLADDGDFWCDREEWRRSGRVVLRMRARVNPVHLHPGARVELAIRRHIVDYQDAHDLAFEDLDLRYGGAHGFGGGNTRTIAIRRCDISWTGGGDLDGKRSTRFGNGIEFWADASGHLVEDCRIWEVYDTALTNQSHGRPVIQRGIAYRGNTTWNCGMASLEVWSRPAASVVEDIVFERNTCVDAGYGWAGGPDQRPVAHGAHLCLWGNEGTLRRIAFRGNTFCRARQTLIYQDPCWRLGQAVACDRNRYWQDDGGLLFRSDPAVRFSLGQFAEYRRMTGYDAGSAVAEPRFREAAAGDFRQSPDSR